MLTNSSRVSKGFGTEEVNSEGVKRGREGQALSRGNWPQQSWKIEERRRDKERKKREQERGMGSLYMCSRFGLGESG